MTSLLPVRQRDSCYLLLRQKHNGRCSAGQALWWYSLSAHPGLTRTRREPWGCEWRRLYHLAWIIFRRAIAAAAANAAICLFFTLSWRIADRANLPAAGGTRRRFPALPGIGSAARAGSPSQHSSMGRPRGRSNRGAEPGCPGREPRTEGAGQCSS